MTGTVDDHSDSYSGPSDMYWRETDAIFHHAEMRTPPAECFNPGNLPIISQGLWTVPETFEGTIELKLTFTIRFVIALQHDTNAVGDSDTRWWWHDQVVERTLKIDWATGKIINADAQEVADWLKIEKNSGASVVAMAHKLAGAPLQQWAWAQGRGNYFGCPVDPTSAPYDHYDFANCYNFLQRFPQYAGDLSSLSGLSGAWRKLVANWSAISKAYAAGQMSTVDSMVAAAHD